MTMARMHLCFIFQPPISKSSFEMHLVTFPCRFGSILSRSAELDQYLVPPEALLGSLLLWFLLCNLCFKSSIIQCAYCPPCPKASGGSDSPCSLTWVGVAGTPLENLSRITLISQRSKPLCWLCLDFYQPWTSVRGMFILCFACTPGVTTNPRSPFAESLLQEESRRVPCPVCILQISTKEEVLPVDMIFINTANARLYFYGVC